MCFIQITRGTIWYINATVTLYYTYHITMTVPPCLMEVYTFTLLDMFICEAYMLKGRNMYFRIISSTCINTEETMWPVINIFQGIAKINCQQSC